MLDDDIIADGRKVLALVQASAACGLAAASIVGMPDNSVVGHLLARAGHQQGQYVSGAGLTIGLAGVKQPFMNRYNEDWLWARFQAGASAVPQPVRLEQLAFDPFFDAVARAQFQEYGEVLWEGVSRSTEPDTLENPTYWRSALEARRTSLSALEEARFAGSLDRVRVSVVAALADVHSRLRPSGLAACMRAHFKNVRLWTDCLRRARSN